ncbi:MAG: nucleotidyltransferase domain-containing protein [Candidatus Hydrothermarchaeota archaeon]
MLQKCDRWELLEPFFREPSREFHLRELARILGWSPGRVIRKIRDFIDEEIILERKTKILKIYKANVESEKFKSLKILYNLNTLQELADFLEKELHYPEAIILFGSVRKGEDFENSDVDICVIGVKKEIDLSFFEKKINRRISLVFLDGERLEKAKKEAPELLNNLINGIVLRGFFKVF